MGGGINGKCVLGAPARAEVILLDVKSNEQRFFDGHTNDVLCLVPSPNYSDVCRAYCTSDCPSSGPPTAFGVGVNRKAWNENRRLCISGQTDVKAGSNQKPGMQAWPFNAVKRLQAESQGADGPKACIWSPDDVSNFCNLLGTQFQSPCQSLAVARGTFTRLHPGHSRSVSAVALSQELSDTLQVYAGLVS